MALAMLSLAGIPVTAGFFGKYFVFTNMIGTPYKWLLILAVLTSGVGVYYYMKVIIAMYFKNADQDSAVDIKMPVKLTIIAAGIVTLFVGVVPGLVAQIFKF
jgi:NADH-quinone oxidoreductase subunit N